MQNGNLFIKTILNASDTEFLFTLYISCIMLLYAALAQYLVKLRNRELPYACLLELASVHLIRMFYLHHIFPVSCSCVSG